MKERFLNFIKWFFIILGVLFLIQLLILSGIFIGFNSVKESKDITPDIKSKEIQPIIEHLDEYYNNNNIYPKSIDLKIKHGEYTYETSNNEKCYKVIYTNKNTKEEYNCCRLNNENSNSKSESYYKTTVK